MLHFSHFISLPFAIWLDETNIDISWPSLYDYRSSKIFWDCLCFLVVLKLHLRLFKNIFRLSVFLGCPQASSVSSKIFWDYQCFLGCSRASSVCLPSAQCNIFRENSQTTCISIYSQYTPFWCYLSNSAEFQVLRFLWCRWWSRWFALVWLSSARTQMWMWGTSLLKRFKQVTKPWCPTKPPFSQTFWKLWSSVELSVCHYIYTCQLKLFVVVSNVSPVLSTTFLFRANGWWY